MPGWLLGATLTGWRRLWAPRQRRSTWDDEHWSEYPDLGLSAPTPTRASEGAPSSDTEGR